MGPHIPGMLNSVWDFGGQVKTLGSFSMILEPFLNCFPVEVGHVVLLAGMLQ